MTELHCGRYRLPLDRPLIMGIINVTPDSFSDGGRFTEAARAVEHGFSLMEAGAALLDVGGESTRPGATPVPLEEELRRVIPVIEQLSGGPVPISIDTRHPEVMRAALAAGATLVNDVNALRAPGALEICAASDAAVCLMHMQGTPQTMQDNPLYGDVLAEVEAFLLQRARAAETAGIARDRILLDPGFGFGKTVAHNLALLRGLERLAAAGYPLLVGLSRKSVLGAVTGRVVSDRVASSVAAALAAVARGASVLRVHDVAATRDALDVWQAVQGETA
ncbi:MAG: dihydropteroate synthase [Betaproteobacteria bacterium]|nr:dihydropteroate synthase [Betaproteobacteria bacterium]MDE2212744.1 dihydropteroate synthase [Betaproteobacteria bacterium]